MQVSNKRSFEDQNVENIERFPLFKSSKRHMAKPLKSHITNNTLKIMMAGARQQAALRSKSQPQTQSQKLMLQENLEFCNDCSRQCDLQQCSACHSRICEWCFTRPIYNSSQGHDDLILCLPCSRNPN